jgi:hypothetical protein
VLQRIHKTLIPNVGTIWYLATVTGHGCPLNRMRIENIALSMKQIHIAFNICIQCCSGAISSSSLLLITVSIKSVLGTQNRKFGHLCSKMLYVHRHQSYRNKIKFCQFLRTKQYSWCPNSSKMPNWSVLVSCGPNPK